MTKAAKSFELAIKDAEDLLARFDNEKNSEIGVLGTFRPEVTLIAIALAS